MSRNLVILQARLSSTRLPGKVLKPLWEGMNLLDLQLQRLKEKRFSHVLATTINPSDDALVNWAKENQVEVFRGDEQDVLKRFIDCANEFEAQNLIRVCSDNPFIQLDQIQDYLNTLDSGVEYISYCNSQGMPAIKTHWGLFVEGVSLTALNRAQKLLEGHPEKAFYSEHVTNFIYGNPDIFKVQLDKAPKEVISRSDLRFTIDTEIDFNNMAKLLGLVEGYEKSLGELINLTDSNPYILKTMQKGINSFTK